MPRGSETGLGRGDTIVSGAEVEQHVLDLAQYIGTARRARAFDDVERVVAEITSDCPVGADRDIPGGQPAGFRLVELCSRHGDVGIGFTTGSVLFNGCDYDAAKLPRIGRGRAKCQNGV